jgi:SagB-type dehydrogenase family enzyme
MHRHTDAAHIISSGYQEEELCRLYHENSKLWPSVEGSKGARSVSQEELLAPVEASRQFATEEAQPLMASHVSVDDRAGSLAGAIATRRSAMDFAEVALELAAVARLLVGSYRVTGELHTSAGQVLLRSAPSAGGLYPIGVYLAAISIEGLARGVYRYDPATTALMTYRLDEDIARHLGQVCSEGKHVRHAAGAMVLTARLARTIAKYGERGYRYVLLEAGHIAQLMSLAAVPLDIALRCYGAFYDEPANRLVGVDGRSESAVYVLLIGGAPTES